VTEKRRFDTYFYLIGLCGPPPPIQQMQDPSGEVTNPVWMSPSEALDAAKNKTIILSPPTTYVLNELQQYGTFEKLFSQVLTTRGVSTLTSTWTPRQHFPEDTKKSMLMITLPGDHQHEPATSAQAEFSPTVKFPSSSSSSTSSLTSASPCGALPLHRVVKRRGHGGWAVVLNIRPPLFGANVGEAPNLRPKL
jgi:hypothetical protein